MKGRSFIDAYRALNDDPGYTFPAEEPKMRIDYVFVKGFKVTSAGRILINNEMSDHFGIYVEVETKR